MKKAVALLVVLIVIAIATWILYRQCCDVTHRDLKDAVSSESSVLQTKIDERYRALDAKLDRIEAKLDKLIDMATPKLPDGMKVAE